MSSQWFVDVEKIRTFNVDENNAMKMIMYKNVKVPRLVLLGAMSECSEAYGKLQTMSRGEHVHYFKISDEAGSQTSFYKWKLQENIAPSLAIPCQVCSLTFTSKPELVRVFCASEFCHSSNEIVLRVHAIRAVSESERKHHAAMVRASFDLASKNEMWNPPQVNSGNQTNQGPNTGNQSNNNSKNQSNNSSASNSGKKMYDEIKCLPEGFAKDLCLDLKVFDMNSKCENTEMGFTASEVIPHFADKYKDKIDVVKESLLDLLNFGVLTTADGEHFQTF